MPIKNVLKKVYLSSLKVIGNKGLGRMPIFKQINKKILKTIKSGSEPVFVNGFKMYLDKNDGSGFSLGTGYEKYETKVMKDHIKKGDIVVDCGGHIGYYSLLFSRLVGKRGKVYTFEADPTNFSLLKKNLEVNNIKNVTAINHAVSDKKGNITMFLDRENSGHNRLFSEKGNDAGKIEINCIIPFFGE